MHCAAYYITDLLFSGGADGAAKNPRATRNRLVFAVSTRVSAALGIATTSD